MERQLRDPRSRGHGIFVLISFSLSLSFEFLSFYLRTILVLWSIFSSFSLSFVRRRTIRGQIELHAGGRELCNCCTGFIIMETFAAAKANRSFERMSQKYRFYTI